MSSTTTPAKSATLQVAVVPFGEVTVDGRSYGRSPVEVVLPPGKHLVRAGRTAALLHRQQVRLRAGQHVELVLELGEHE